MKPFATTLATLLIAGCAYPLKPVGPPPEWQTFENAVTFSERSGKNILVAVYAPWCGWCRKLEHEVYTDPAVRQYMTANFELARVNGEDHEERHRYRGTLLSSSDLAQHLGASGYPATIILSPGGKHIIARAPGYMDSRTYLGVLRYVAEGVPREQAPAGQQ